MRKLLILAGLLLLPFAAQAQAPAQVNGCQYLSTPPSLSDKQTVTFQCDSAGALKVAGSISASTSATATVADPSYVEGTDDNLSMDLSGHLRTILPSSQVITTGTAGSASTQVITVQGIASMTPVGVSVASGGIASGGIASGALASGSVASGAIASGAVASGAYASGSISDGADVTLGAKADAKSTATDTTAITIMQVLKEISAMVQAPVAGTPLTSGGLSWYFVQPTASDNHVVIKAGAGQVYNIQVTNNSATVNYLRLYNATTGFNGCNSATNIVGQWAIPASTSVGGASWSIPQGIAFATGISICVTSAYATTDTTNATASAMSVNIGYK